MLMEDCRAQGHQSSIDSLHSDESTTPPLFPGRGAPPSIPVGVPPPQQAMASRPSFAPKAAPPLPPKMAGKAPPPVPQVRPSIGGKQSIGGINGGAIPEKAPVISEMINLHWKPASAHHSGPSNRLSPGLEADQFLRPFSTPQSASLEELLNEHPIPDVVSAILGDSTVFSAAVPAPHVSVETVKQFFARKQNTKFDSMSTSSSAGAVAARDEPIKGAKKTALDRERLKLVALALGGTISSRSNRRLIFRQYREAIIKCDYAVLTTDIMCPLLQLLKNVPEEELTASVEFVKQDVNISSLPEAVLLESFEEADVFLFEMSKIPEVKVRLECMIFEKTFEDLFQLTVNSLNVIHLGLQAINSNLEKITRIFQLVLKTGNLLNEGSKLGSTQTSFSLATLAKLNEVKSSMDPKIDLLHFILAQLPIDESYIFSDEDFSRLKNASNLRCYRVRDEVKDLLDSITAVNEIVKHPIEAAGPEDKFTTRMERFAGKIYGTEQWMSRFAFNVFASYKFLSNYFEDSKAVYPPPKEKTAEQFDIIELFAWFAGVCRGHEKDIKKKDLRSKVQSVEHVTAPIVLPRKPPPPPVVVLEPVIESPVISEVNYTITSLGGSRSLLKSSSSLPYQEDRSSRRPSLSKELLNSTLSNLNAGSTAPPLVAIINRGSGRDLTASKPKLSPSFAPASIDVLVTPVVNEPDLSVKHEQPPLTTPSNAAAQPRRPFLITPNSSSHARGKTSADLLVSVVPRLSLGTSKAVPPNPTTKLAENSDENDNFFSNRPYPNRNHEEQYSSYALLNSRQSLSNTISRVAMLLSPSKEDGSTIYKGARRNRPSFVPESTSRDAHP